MRFMLVVELGGEELADYWDLGSKLRSVGADLKAMYDEGRSFHSKDGSSILDGEGKLLGSWEVLG